MTPPPPPPPTHYSILNIPYPPRHPLLKQDLKLAYHRALLKHHPDKDKSRSGTNTPISTPSHTNGNSTAPISQPTSTNSGTDSANNTSGADANNHPKIKYTIDQITSAYKTLADPTARAGYDRELRLSSSSSGMINNSTHTAANGSTEDNTMFRTGMETFDLDDMTEADDDGTGVVTGIWYHSCRCGEEGGFLVSEEDLEREVERGEVVVGCRGCSLWARVVFAVDEGEGEGEEGVS